MSPAVTTHRRPAASPRHEPALVREAARVLLGLYGLFLLPAVLYFTFFASVEEGRVTSVGDAVVAAWGLAVAAGLLLSAARLGKGSGRPVQLALVVVLAQVAFGLVKYLGYGESEALGLLAVDLLLLGLLSALLRSVPLNAAPAVRSAVSRSAS